MALGAGAVAGASAHHALRHVAGEPGGALRTVVGVLAEALRATPAGLNRAGAAGAAREGASDVLAAGLARVARVALRHTAAVAAAGLVAAFGLSALVAPHLGAGAITTAARARVATVEPGVAAHVDAVAPLVTSVRLLRARRAAGAGRCWQQRCVRQLRVAATGGRTEVHSPSIIIAIVLTHSKPGSQRVCMLGGIIPPQVEPAGAKSTHSLAPSHCIVDGRQNPDEQSPSSLQAPDAPPPEAAPCAAEQSGSRQVVPSAKAMQYGVAWRKHAIMVHMVVWPCSTPQVLQPSFQETQSSGIALPAKLGGAGGIGSMGCGGAGGSGSTGRGGGDTGPVHWQHEFAPPLMHSSAEVAPMFRQAIREQKRLERSCVCTQAPT